MDGRKKQLNISPKKRLLMYIGLGIHMLCIFLWILFGFALAWGAADGGYNITDLLFEELRRGGLASVLSLFYIVYTVVIALCCIAFVMLLFFWVYKKVKAKFFRA